MLPPVFDALKSSAPVTKLIGTNPVRAYPHGNAPQGVIAPYVTWSTPAGDATMPFDGADADTFRVQVDCWSEQDAEVETLAAAVRAAIEPHAYLVAYVADERDADTKKFRLSFVFDWWLPR